VSDVRVVSDPVFLSTSVTAERWVPVVEVGEAALVPWLLNRRAEGCARFRGRGCLGGGE